MKQMQPQIEMGAISGPFGIGTFVMTCAGAVSCMRRSTIMKSAIEQLNAEKPIKIVRELPEGVRNWAPPGGSMVVVNPRVVDGVMRGIAPGKVTTLDHIRSLLAERYGTSIACPVSTAIFINIAARAAEESRQTGSAEITPWWRTLRSDGSLNDKYPGGIRTQRAILESEGVTVVQRGRKWFVADFEARLADLPA
jgi:alkylated DNA nucleotide flippase Atl1